MDTLCQFFISAFKEDGRSLGGTETASSSDNTSIEAVDHLRVDILRALSAVLFENGSQVKDVSVFILGKLLC